MKTIDIELKDVINIFEEQYCDVFGKTDDSEHYAWAIDEHVIAVEKTPEYGTTLLLYESFKDYFESVQDTWVLDWYISEDFNEVSAEFI